MAGLASVHDEQDSLKALLEGRLGTHIRRISRLIIAAKAEALRPLELTVPQYATMLSIKHLEPTSAAELARVGDATPQTTATMLRTLEVKGLIARSPSSMHRKLVEIRLTDSGTKLVEEADKLASNIEDKLRARIGEDLFHGVLHVEDCARALFADD